MKKVLVILPKSIAGELIMKSFASGFEVNDCFVMAQEIDKVSSETLNYFRPDMIIGYDYSFLMDENCKKAVDAYSCKNFVFYFADEPKGTFALGKKDCLFNSLNSMDAKIFIWDREFLGEFDGKKTKSYFLPLAASPYKYATDFSGYKYPMTFVGRPLTKRRQKILSKIVSVYGNKLSIFSFKKHFDQSVEEISEQNLLDENELEIYKNCWKGFITKEEELADIYNSSKINLNITLQGKSSLNYRVFEVLAAGGFLLTDEMDDLNQYFEISKHLETYKDESDLIDKIDFYLQNLNIAQRIAQLGKIECTENHNYAKRAATILSKVF